MAEPDWNTDTAGRSLAEILREAGIEAPRSGRRGRRWDDEDTGIRQRRTEAPAPSPNGFGRRAGDLRAADDRGTGERPARDRGPRDAAPARDAPPVRRAADPSTAAIPGLRPSPHPRRARAGDTAARSA